MLRQSEETATDQQMQAMEALERLPQSLVLLSPMREVGVAWLQRERKELGALVGAVQEQTQMETQEPQIQAVVAVAVVARVADRLCWATAATVAPV